MTVQLGVVPHDQTHLVVIGTTVRKPANIASAWLQSLAWQVIPRQVKPFYLFIDDGSPKETRELLEAFVQQHGGAIADAEPAPAGDFTDQGITHGWTDSAMQRVGRSKDRILAFARENRAEAVWFCDADLICDPMTLTSLWSIPEPVVCAVYWTRWHQPPPEHPPIHAGPQVWLSHPYQLQGLGMEEWEFRSRLMRRQVTEVVGQGACTLIRRSALMKGVSFAPWPGNQMPGIGQGEDRHFCMRAEALHLRMVADPWPDIFHIYHRPDDEALIPEMLTRLSMYTPPPDPLTGEAIPGNPGIGDLVSLELHAMEPIPTQHGLTPAPTQYVRGRLGQVGLHPELSEAVTGMQRGEVKIVPVHFGLDYPFPPYRGLRRLIRVTLIDHKPFGLPPVVEDEVLTNRIGATMDTTTLTPGLIDQMREVHAV
jgi:hypothetical protein